MANITPFADPNAHGSLAGSITFRRRYGKVILQKKSDPKQPNTAGQLAQRSAFTDAQKDWYFYDSISKDFWEKRGAELGMSGRNLFTKATLLGTMPSNSQANIQDMPSGQIINPLGDVTHENQPIFQVFQNGITLKTIAFINDPELIWYHGPASTPPNSKWRVRGDTEYIIPFRWLITATATLDGGGSQDFYLRFPETPIGFFEYWLSDDGSMYSDEAMTHLVCSNVV